MTDYKIKDRMKGALTDTTSCVNSLYTIYLYEIEVYPKASIMYTHNVKISMSFI